MSEDKRIANSIKAHGWHAISVNDATPPFLYTIGMCVTFQHPDMIVFGEEPGIAHGICTALIERIRKNGANFSISGIYQLTDDILVTTQPVNPGWHEVYLGYAMGYYRYVKKPMLLRAIQIVMPDDHGRFPDAPDCDPLTKASQPFLALPPTEQELKEFREEFGGEPL